MSSPAAPPRERILHAALTLLEAGGLDAVSTRSVCAAAHVQAPTIYRLYGSMQGLLDAVAGVGHAAYLQVKASSEAHTDPLDELRAGWDAHVAYGLAHPHLYALMNGGTGRRVHDTATTAGAEMLRGLLRRLAATGRLAVNVDRAADLIHAGAVGVTLTLLGRTEPDPALASTMRDAILRTILTPGDAPARPEAQQTAAHAVALGALLPQVTALSAAERTLLQEWLGRVAGTS